MKSKRLSAFFLSLFLLLGFSLPAFAQTLSAMSNISQPLPGVQAEALSMTPPAKPETRSFSGPSGELDHILLPDDKAKQGKAEKKLDSSLLQLVDDRFIPNGQSKDKLVEQMKGQKQIVNLPDKVNPQGKLVLGVNVYIKLKKGADIDSIQSYVIGIKHRGYASHLAVATVDVNRLSELASLDSVQSIQTIMPPVVRAGSAQSQGDSVLKADLARAGYGLSGQGVKIGVISDGVDNLAYAQSKGDLDSVTVLRNTAGGDEGTAMLEIVHDLAPNASLYFHDCGSDIYDFNDGITALVNAGCDIIVDDIGWILEPFFEDGEVAAHVKDVLQDHNVVYVSSAGNAADSHYQGTFYDDGTGQGFNDFSRGTSQYTYLYASIPDGAAITPVLQWNEDFDNATSDYDLYMFNYSTGSLVAYSYDDQSITKTPLEAFQYKNTTGSTITVALIVKAYNAPVPKMLEMYIYQNAGYVYSNNISAADSIFGHPAVPDVIACGAVRASTPDDIEYFSSQGPVTMLSGTRNKPDVCGVDGVSVTGAGGFSNPFYGTSAAAPHIAAVAALLMERFPTMSAHEIRDLILENTDDLGDANFDEIFGNGRADAILAAGSHVYAKFNTNGGSSVKSALAEKGDTIPKPTDPTQDRYWFVGWYKEATLETPWNFATDTVNQDTTLYAKWTDDANGDGYNDFDFSRIQAFLNQPSAVSGITNGQQINKNYNPDDPTTWTGVDWGFNSSKYISAIGQSGSWSDKSLAGSFNLSGMNKLVTLQVNHNRITSFNFSGCTSLNILSCNGNQLTSLDLGDCKCLIRLDCGNNQITALNVGAIAGLEQLECYNNRLTSLDVSNSAKLSYLLCNDNNLATLDVSANKELVNLNCSHNALTSLDLSNNSKLNRLYCAENRIGILDVSYKADLFEFTCNSNLLSSLTVYGCSKLTYFICSNNNLMYLDLSTNTAIETLSCDKNQLKALDVSASSSLNALFCSGNPLTSIHATIHGASVRLQAVGHGTIELSYYYSSLFSVTAYRENNYYVFKNWTSSGALVSNNEKIYLTLGNAYNLQANFDNLCYCPIYVKTSNAKLGTVTGAGTYGTGQQITVAATPKSGCCFINWVDWPSKFASNDSAYTFTVDGNSRTLIANFASIGTPKTSVSVTGYSTVKLSWGAVPYAKGYEIYRSTSSRGGFGLIAKVDGTTGYTDTPLESTRTYYYQVRAYCVAGTLMTYGKFSSTKSAKPTWPAVKLTASLSGYHTANLRWNSVAEADGYGIWRSTSSKGGFVKVGETVGTSFQQAGLAAGSTYYYKVVPFDVVNGAQVSGPFSNVKSVSPKWPRISLRTAVQTYHTAYLSWNAISSVSGYEVERSASSKGGFALVADTASTSFTDPGIPLDRTYYYRIRPYAMVGQSRVYGAYSNVKSVKPKWPTVVIKSAIAAPSDIALGWNTLSNVSGYEVWRSGNPASGFVPIGDTAVNSYTDGTVAAGLKVYYKIRPYCIVGGNRVYGPLSKAKAIQMP